MIERLSARVVPTRKSVNFLIFFNYLEISPGKILQKTPGKSGPAGKNFHLKPARLSPWEGLSRFTCVRGLSLPLFGNATRDGHADAL